MLRAESRFGLSHKQASWNTSLFVELGASTMAVIRNPGVQETTHCDSGQKTRELLD